MRLLPKRKEEKMAESKSLEDFVKTYIQNKAKSETAESYASWLKANGIDSEKIYADSIKDISADYHRQRSEYGRFAEGLADIGLTASGYSDYLNSAAYAEMQRRKAGARSKYSENEAENRRGYSDYLNEVREKENSTYKRVVDGIKNEGIMNYESAYKYAVGAGLSEEAASAAAKSASDMVREDVIKGAIKTIITYSYNAKQARAYATALGLSEEEANELAKYAESINAYGYYNK